jgi:pilus assembly protein CpaF
VTAFVSETEGIAPGVLAAIARQVGEQLADDRLRRATSGATAFDQGDERRLALGIIGRLLDELAADRLRSGLDPYDDESERALADAVLDTVFGLGRIEPLLADETINDIHIRGCEPVWVKRSDGRREQLPPVVATDAELVDLVRRTAARDGRGERRLDAATPELNMQLPDGSRLFAAIEVCSRPAVVIRRHRFTLSALHELRERELVTPMLGDFLSAAVRARRNIVVSGGTGSGKTTLLRALLNEVPSRERIVTIEDAYELGLDRFAHLHPDHDMLQSRPANIEGRGEVTLLDLTRMALRMDRRPSRCCWR